MENNRHISLLILISGIILSFFSSCTKVDPIEIDYSFESAIDVKQGIKNYDQISFKHHENLDLGFYKGNVWVKLEITNREDYASYIVMMNDLINRNYRFYKLDTLNDELNPVSAVDDLTKQDHRTFNYPKPNFKISLQPYEKATYVISTESDGRILQATPQLLTMEEYGSLINRKTLVNIIFLILIGLLLAINIFHWRTMFKNKIYYYYGFYILSSCLFYLYVEGYLYGLGLTHLIIDHLMFLSIRIWIFSAVLFASIFLELNVTNPKFYGAIKWLLFIILGVTTLYQFIFFNSSIPNLHIAENLLGFLWIVLSIAIIAYSIKKRRLETKYYLVAYSFFLFFIILGLIDSHTTLLPGDPFFYFKIGTIIEFIGLTYFITVLIRRKIARAETLENELQENRKELTRASEKLEEKEKLLSSKTGIEKTDLISIFKLLENSLSKEDDWLEFKSKFEELNPSFLEQLLAARFDLSKSEIRLLTLFRIGYSQKEIATILSIAPDSVKKAKSRVRKKLNLTESISLNDFLHKL